MTGNCENNVCPNRSKWYVSKSKALIDYKINKTPKILKMWTEHSILVRTTDLNFANKAEYICKTTDKGMPKKLV